MRRHAFIIICSLALICLTVEARAEKVQLNMDNYTAISVKYKFQTQQGILAPHTDAIPIGSFDISAPQQWVFEIKNTNCNPGTLNIRDTQGFNLIDIQGSTSTYITIVATNMEGGGPGDRLYCYFNHH